MSPIQEATYLLMRRWASKATESFPTNDSFSWRAFSSISWRTSTISILFTVSLRLNPLALFSIVSDIYSCFLVGVFRSFLLSWLIMFLYSDVISITTAASKRNRINKNLKLQHNHTLHLQLINLFTYTGNHNLRSLKHLLLTFFVPVLCFFF